MSRRVLGIVSTFNAPRFVTLTLRHRVETLTEMMSRLGDAVRKLRRTDAWRSRVTAGVCATEVTWNERDGTWHAHVHLIVDGEFLPQRMLSKLWLEVTGDSMIVDVRAVPDRRRAVDYVARYIAKPSGLHEWPPERVLEFADATRSRRFLNTFGAARKVKVDDDSLGQEKASVERICSVARVARHAAAGDARAQHAVELLRRLELFVPVRTVEPGAIGRPCRVPVESWEVALLVSQLREIASDAARGATATFDATLHRPLDVITNAAPVQRTLEWVWSRTR